ncbi:hypothetical protein [Stutzerimonas zhaodongensis]|uniref:hypothetical protein n=1 Tax=Stutzerimonas zhaodongensis TaxID=1176257 RepID=UPI002107C88D|nr:hypothetical protein [Stutzerimonas zhaodongensis]MCQ2029034.1 hypothetical protein [Stutzerimonas zhaodongensis]
MNIAELADSHLDLLLQHSRSAHVEQIAIIDKALDGDEEARAIFREMAKTISADLQGGVIQ